MNGNRFAFYAWGVLAYTLLVILWGAAVRATGSGAGCGSHWPLCNGDVVPRAPEVATLIEFGHRLTSGLAFLLVVGLLVWALRAYPRGAPVRRAAWAAMFFMITESLIGAGLVLLELVADNTSLHRAVWMALHLANTFLLILPLTLVAWWASGGRQLERMPWRSKHTWALLGALVGVIWLGSSGAVTALGDTLFPVESLAAGGGQDLSSTAHLYARLRLFHPAIAGLVGLYLLWVVWYLAQSFSAPAVIWLGRGLLGLLGLQVLAGAVNVALLVPLWMQLSHLLLANLVWIVLVLLTAEALARVPAARTTAAAGMAAHPAH